VKILNDTVGWREEGSGTREGSGCGLTRWCGFTRQDDPQLAEAIAASLRGEDAVRKQLFAD
jgi:hypothetical protein